MKIEPRVESCSGTRSWDGNDDDDEGDQLNVAKNLKFGGLDEAEGVTDRTITGIMQTEGCSGRFVVVSVIQSSEQASNDR